VSKQEKEALRKSEAKYRIIFETAREGICQLDEHFNITLANHSLADMLGYKVEEMIGRSLFDFIIRCEMQDIRQSNAEHRQSLLERFDWCLRRKDGWEIWAIISGKPMMTDNEQFNYGVAMITDITDRRQAAESLATEKRRLADIIRGTNVGTWEWNVQTGETVFSERWAGIIGYTLKEISPTTIDTWVKFTHPEDLKKSDELLALHFSGKSDYYECEARMRHKNGSWVWILDRGKVATFTPDGKPLLMSGTHQDITERRQTEDQIRNSKRLLQIMLDANPEIVLLIDINGIVLAANRTIASRLEKTIHEIIGKNFYDMLPPDTAQKCRANIGKVIQTKEKTYFEDQSGEQYFLSIIVPISDENEQVEKIFIMAVDITERKNFEETLRQSREQYRNFVENMSEGFVVFNKNMEVAYVNEKFCQITGYEREELIGRTIFHYFDEDNQNIVKEQFIKRHDGETAPYQLESIRKDGSRIFINVSPRPVFDSDGVFQGSFAVVIDISLKKESEEMLRSEHRSIKEQNHLTMMQMKELSREVEEYNHAIKVLLKNSQNDQKTVEEKIVSNVREMVVPFFDKLKNTRLSEVQKDILDIVETNLNNIISPFVSRLKSEMRDFTPMEIQVANLIKEGRTIKEIADILSISENTVMFHRTNIRQKLGLRHQKTNLRTYLLSVSASS
jgi:PAS domain S-box-containing protein